MHQKQGVGVYRLSSGGVAPLLYVLPGLDGSAKSHIYLSIQARHERHRHISGAQLVGDLSTVALMDLRWVQLMHMCLSDWGTAAGAVSASPGSRHLLSSPAPQLQHPPAVPLW